mgnify:CR=1 FL=1
MAQRTTAPEEIEMLRNAGYRYGLSRGEFRWVHPLEAGEDFVDCSEMSDEEFERFVAQVEARGEQPQAQH